MPRAPDEPKAVTAALIVLSMQMLSGLPMLLIPIVIGSSTFGWFSGCTVAAIVWTVVASAVYSQFLHKRDKRGWAGAVALLAVKLAVLVAVLIGWWGPRLWAVLQERFTPQELLIAAILLLIPATYAAILAVLVSGLFRARGWFGIGQREGWLALGRQGRLPLVLTSLTELCLAALVIAGARAW